MCIYFFSLLCSLSNPKLSIYIFFFYYFQSIYWLVIVTYDILHYLNNTKFIQNALVSLSSELLTAEWQGPMSNSVHGVVVLCNTVSSWSFHRFGVLAWNFSSQEFVFLEIIFMAFGYFKRQMSQNRIYTAKSKLREKPGGGCLFWLTSYSLKAEIHCSLIWFARENFLKLLIEWFE